MDELAAYVHRVAVNLLLPYAFGLVVSYAFCYNDYLLDIQLEERANNIGKSEGEEARLRVWAQAKHEHSFPLYKESGGVRGAYARIWKQVLWIDCVMSPLAALCTGWLCDVFPPLTAAYDPPSSSAVISFLTAVARIAVSLWIYQIGLFVVHVVLHRPQFYAAIHKLHHIGPQCALAGNYITSLEATMNGNSLFFVMVAMMGLPPWAVAVVAAFGRINLGATHSGWRELDVRGPPEAAYHGVHHRSGHMKDRNLANAAWLDKLMGSYVDPRVSFAQSYPKQA